MSSCFMLTRFRLFALIAQFTSAIQLLETRPQYLTPN